MHPYKNLLSKVRALLKEDDNLTKGQCESMQWQLLVKIADYSFFVGKGGVNTIFYSASDKDREVCYPEDILTLLERLCKTQTFVYAVADKHNKLLGYSIDIERAKNIDGAVKLAAVDFRGKRKVIANKVADVFGKITWKEKGSK